MEQGDETARSDRLTAANDNGPGDDPASINATLTRIAEAIGRHIAREHIRIRKAANDNDLGENPPVPEP